MEWGLRAAPLIAVIETMPLSTSALLIRSVASFGSEGSITTRSCRYRVSIRTQIGFSQRTPRRVLDQPWSGIDRWVRR